MSRREEAEELYSELQQEYKSPYFPSAEEKNEAIIILIRLVIKGYDKPAMIHKVKALATLHGAHKTKFSNLVINEFWKQDIQFGVQPTKFREE